MLIYNGYGFYKDTLSSLSLGNMGFSQTHCLIETMSEKRLLGKQSNDITLQCNSGFISELIDFGITT